MSAAVLEAPARLFAPAPALSRAPARGEDPPGGRRTTLAELLDETWRAARAGAEAECPMCQAPLHAVAGAARCGSCGTTLS
jgi:hypothetical protein